MSKPPFEAALGRYPYGTQYHRAPTPRPEEWAGDLAELGRLGYTHVQFRPQWIWHERLRGQPVWEELDQLFDLAAAAGLKVILKPMLECAPDWVYTELDGYRIDLQGNRIGPWAHGAFYVGGWLPCFDNPAVAQAASDWTQALAARYSGHPALWFYNAWNEPRSRPLGQCACQHSQKLYREWLRQRFGTLEALNDFCGKAWTSFDTITAPTAPWDYIQMHLWRTWATERVAAHLGLARDAIKAVHPEAFVMTHVGMCSVVQDAACDASDDLLNAARVDRYGTSFPVSLAPTTPRAFAGPDLLSDWLRRVDEDYWCQELYVNAGEWSRPPSLAAVRRVVWQAIAGGAVGVTFWQWRSERVGNETNGWGARNIDGSQTERGQVVDSIAAVLREKGQALLGAHPPQSPIALLYNRPSDLLSRITKLNLSDIQQSGNLEAGSVDYPYKRALQSAHALWKATGHTVEFVVPGDELSGVKLLHVTCDELISAQTADWLRDFVRGGGKLLVEFPFACRDDNTWVAPVRPFHGLADLLGCAEQERVVTGGDDSVSFPSGSRLVATDWRIDLAPAGGDPLATWHDGKPAAVWHSYGEGEVLSLGLNLSLAFGDSFSDGALAVFGQLVRELLPDVQPEGQPDLWVRRRVGEAREVWFVFNLADGERALKLPAQPTAIWDGEGCRLCGLELRLPAKATWVAELPKT